MFTPIIRSLCIASVALLSATLVQAQSPKIGLLLKAKSPYWEAIEKGAVEAAKSAGYEVIAMAPPSEDQVGLQAQYLTVLSNKGITALLVAASSKDGLSAPLGALSAKGVKIVAIDSPLAGNVAASFVGSDNRAAGETAGALVAGLVKDGDEVALFRHNQTSSAAQERELGVIKKLTQVHAKLTVHSDVYASSESGAEAQRAEYLLGKYPKAGAIIATGTPGSLGMLKVLKARGLAGKIPFVGFGFNLNSEVDKALREGAMKAWVAQLPGNIGQKGVETAVALLKGETVPAVVPVDVLVVTKENVDTPKVQALLH